MIKHSGRAPAYPHANAWVALSLLASQRTFHFGLKHAAQSLTLTVWKMIVERLKFALMRHALKDVASGNARRGIEIR
jgi:hypothetical protein